MSRQRIFNLVVLASMVVSLLVGGGGQVFAQGQGPKDGQGPKYPHQLQRPVTKADRQAAAANQKAAREAAAKTATVTAVAAAPQGGVPDYFGAPNWAFSPLPAVVGGVPTAGTGVLKFQTALADTPTTPGGLTLATGSPCTISGQAAQCYEIHLQQFQVQILPAGWPMTTIRGYVEYLNGVAQAKTYLGPTIVAQRGVPVRIEFHNDLGTGADGDLFIPVDTTYMGAGMGPKCENTTMVPPYVDMAADGTCPAGYTPAMYTQNRATLHLHGGTTPWISDGTPHQWITPANETTAYPQGVSVQNVPDMTACGAANDGCSTFYYSNEQSARLMFYHDHSYGITRLNVYAGEAAGYLLNDSDATRDPITPAYGVGIPLVLQDKSFVDASTVLITDPTWRWGTGAVTGATADGLAIHAPNTGDLWFPHVYMPNQNPYDITGANGFGRWDYGPWFWPPFTGLVHGAIPNPYCLPTPPASGSTEANPGPYDCSATPWEPPFIPGTPSNSSTPEAFGDTPVVNGVAYPVLNVAAGLVRFRILNASNDRFMNLQLYQAAPSIVSSFTIVNAGAGYTSAPAVTITPAAGEPLVSAGGGTGATAIAAIDPVTGAVTGISLNTTGSSYTLPPVVTIAPPPAGGTQATATANLYTAPTEVGMVPFNANQNAITPFPAAWYTPGLPFVLDDRAGGVPDPRLRGPAMVQIGTEGGFLPNPAVINNQPVNFDYNRKSITVLNILQHALFLGPAERADILVDFSQFAGKTLILYQDSTAPTPASDSRLDFYTGDPNQTDMGGAPTTLPGYGPNTRTIMQIKVAGIDSGVPGPVDYVDATSLTALQTALPAAFGASQETIIQPQTAYNAVYAPGVNCNVTPLPAGCAPTGVSQYVRIQDTTHTFNPIGYTPAVTVTAQLQPKAIQELFTVDYGRMNATLGVEIPNTNGVNQTTIPYGYVDPITELLQVSDAKAVQVNAPVSPQTVGTLADGTQIWKITHNGVDTHVIHVHMFVMQLINRVGWDGAIKPPDANELGWKDTYRMNPLEDVIVAVRPIKLQSPPFKLPNSIRPMDVTLPLGASNAANTPGFFQVDPAGNPMTPLITNQMVNFGWEYVWHCHILGHEENDMMRPMAVAVPPDDPTNLAANTSGNGNKKVVILTWTDNSLNSTGFTVQRDTVSTFDSPNLVNIQVGKVTTYTDPIGNTSTVYFYRVRADNTIGSTASSGFRTSVGGAYSTLTASSNFTAGVFANPPVAPFAPTNLVATLQNVGTQAAPVPQMLLTFTDNATNETGFNLERSVNGGPYALLQQLPPRTNTGSVSATDTTVTLGNTYQYRVQAFVTQQGITVTSTYAYSGVVIVSVPSAPGLLTISTVRSGSNNTVTLTWAPPTIASQTSYTVEWSTDNFATVLGTKTGIAATATLTTVSVLRGTVPPGVVYSFRIRAVNVLGTSGPSNVLSIRTV